MVVAYLALSPPIIRSYLYDMVIVAPYVTLVAPFDAPAAPLSLEACELPLLPPAVASGALEFAPGAVELLSSAMVDGRCWVVGGCVRAVEIVLVVVKIF